MGCGSSTSTTVTSSTDYHESNNGILDNNYSGSVRKISITKLSSRPGKNFKIEDRVHVRGYIGTVKFVGPTGLGGTGENWVGIELDHKHEQGNDGSIDGVHFFLCKPKHGMFAKLSVVQLFDDNIDAINNRWHKISTQTLVLMQSTIRRYLASVRLRKLQARSGVEREIDKHVLRTSKEEAATVNRLSEYLTMPWSDERKKALAIYRWITLNIAYDTDGIFGTASRTNCDAESVLQNRCCVCYGYANLFEALCKAAKLEVQTVGGYTKSYGYNPKQKFVNLLKVNGKWYLCEVTSGAGYIGDDMMFVREPSLQYFLMDPQYIDYKFRGWERLLQ